MPRCKITKKISEIGKYFEKTEEKAMTAMLESIEWLRLTDSKLGLSTPRNASYRSIDKLLVLVLMTFFEIGRLSGYEGSWLHGKMEAGKDAFYRLLRGTKTDWRKLYDRFSGLLIGKMRERAASRKDGGLPTCLVADDTDFPKRGMAMELVGRVFSHTLHKHIVGYKCLTLGLNDGCTFMPLDFSIHGELGRNKDQGLTAKQRKARHESNCREGDAAHDRMSEYFSNKVDVLVTMVRRAVCRGIEFEYLLVDSWFVCDKLIKAVLQLDGGRHVLGMAKNGKETFTVDGKAMNAANIIKTHWRKKVKCSRHRCRYFSVMAEYKGTPVRLFFCQRNSCDGWKIILTTDTRLRFLRAYEIYAMRWSIEVYFKEGKQFLMLGKNQSVYLTSQIAATTISMMQYSLLAFVKGTTEYETLGGLFRGTVADTAELTLYERVLSILAELLEEFLGFIGFPNKKIVATFLSQDEMILNAINRSRLMKYA